MGHDPRQDTVTRAEFQRAGVLGSKLHAALGAKEVGAEGRSAAQALWNLRQRAFSLFVRTYEECRRGVHFLRWHQGDADQFAPSLYRKRRRSANGSGSALVPGAAVRIRDG